MLRRGFSLIELMVVVAIIAVLVAGTVPYVQGYVEEAKITKTKETMTSIRSAIQRFEMDHNYMYKPTKEDGTDLKLDLENWQTGLMGYISGNMNDAWGRPFYYSYAGSFIVSSAQDGRLDTNVIVMDTKPPFAPAQAWFVDNNKNGLPDSGDLIKVTFTRPIGALTLGAGVFQRREKSTELFADVTNVVLKTDSFEGDQVAIFSITGDTNLKVGDELRFGATVTDASAACGSAPSGIYTPDNVLAEGLHTRAEVLEADLAPLNTPQASLPTPVVLKAAQ